MRVVLVGVGLLFLFGGSGYAQNSTPETSKPNAAPTAPSSSNSSTGAASAATQAQARTEEPSSGKVKDADTEPSERRTHVRLGGIAVSAGYAQFLPVFYPSFPYSPFFSPFTAAWWNPFWGLYPAFPAGYFSQGDGKGELKLNGVPGNAAVYLNGGYAGTADHLKRFWLDPGVYDLEVSLPGGRRYERRVYVLTGKTLHIEPKPMPGKQGEEL